jgi:phage gp29-like protein
VLLASRMGERFPAFMGAVAEITDALGDQYRVTPASDKRDDIKIADAVKRVVEGDAFQLYLVDLRDAISVGYSTGEMRWAPDSEGRFVPAEFIKVPADAIKYADDGVTPLIHTGSYRYEPLEWGRFISHVSRVRSGLPVNVGMAKSAAYLYLFASLAWSSWSGQLERGDKPYLIGTHQKDNNEQVDALSDVIQNLHEDASAVFEDGMAIHVLEGAVPRNGKLTYGEFLAAIDKQVRVAVLKIDMNDTSAGSRALGEVLDKTKQKRFRTFAFQESATLRRDMVRAIMAVNFEGGAVRPAPRLALDIEGSEDMNAVAVALAPLVDRGVQFEVAEVLDRCGWPVPADLPQGLKMFPLNTPQVVDESRTKAAETKAQVYAETILRIVDEAENIRDKRSLTSRIKALALEAGLDVSAAA